MELTLNENARNRFAMVDINDMDEDGQIHEQISEIQEEMEEDRETQSESLIDYDG